MSFLPITKQDMKDRGWDELDFLYISGDAYVDHPSFGHAIITRILESEGYKVGIVAQPDWKKSNDFMTLGRPKLGVLISSGVIDSMVNHYTASKKTRSDDLYSPGGKGHKRPDRAVIVYTNKVRELFKDIPIIIGGIEASLRRFAHYDYWDDKVRRSILVDSKADLLIYGMGEKPILEIAKRLKEGVPVSEIKDVRGTAYLAGLDNLPENIKDFVDGASKASENGLAILPSFEEVVDNKKKYAEAFIIQYNEQDPYTGHTMIQKHGDRYLVQNPPIMPMDEKEMDRVYSLPYERTYHPIYESEGGVPAISEVEFSITSHRGCYGGCSFCALNFHQGRIIQKRSQSSIINEAKKIIWQPGFKGYIHDVGGPTANFRNKACKKQSTKGVCKERQCLYPEPCKNLIVDHSEYLALLRKLREIPEVKKVFIRSGIRYDYLMLDKNDDFFIELCKHHVSGQLKVAPEHVVDRVLEKMGKPQRKVYDRFVKKFYDINKKINKEQYLVPYLISSHPGSDLNAAIELALYLKEMNYTPQQVQDFYPTPGTLSTCMFYTEIDPRTMKKVYVPKSPKEKAMQRALLQYRKKENYNLVYEALTTANREDLIGFGSKYLIMPKRKDKYGFSKETEIKHRGDNEREKGKKATPKKKDAANNRMDKKRINSNKIDRYEGEGRRVEKNNWKESNNEKGRGKANKTETNKVNAGAFDRKNKIANKGIDKKSNTSMNKNANRKIESSKKSIESSKKSVESKNDNRNANIKNTANKKDKRSGNKKGNGKKTNKIDKKSIIK
ncbi:YgiQ family radical SAM protein [Acetivibrio cellulolyticus]|uniref:YgiQ family radical SAM protein n=1 Tax=Acetivibrio cellulolyticus TaxID=35830 RepID=UPI0001E2C6EC|nr:YgiQ family radical SAM protein [Acetivibrio cellulolyticus]